jgi:hypothetical protein
MKIFPSGRADFSFAVLNFFLFGYTEIRHRAWHWLGRCSTSSSTPLSLLLWWYLRQCLTFWYFIFSWVGVYCSIYKGSFNASNRLDFSRVGLDCLPSIYTFCSIWNSRTVPPLTALGWHGGRTNFCLAWARTKILMISTSWVVDYLLLNLKKGNKIWKPTVYFWHAENRWQYETSTENLHISMMPQKVCLSPAEHSVHLLNDGTSANAKQIK